MKEYQVNLIDGIRPLGDEPEKKKHQPTPRSKQGKVGRFFFKFSLVLLVIVVIFYTNTMFASQGLIGGVGRLSFWEGMARLALGKDKILKGELGDRINFLILGVGGADHEGPYLTDTMILLSLKPSTNEVALFSIPRDLYVPTADFGWQKINAINSLGMTRSSDGTVLTSKVVGDLFDIPVHYWVRVDFAVFKDFVDLLGGVNISVDQAFTDNQYPAANYQFKVVSFRAGPQSMDGTKALQFARSRHGDNNEGSDFGRMKRQQKLIMAIKEKIQKNGFVTSPAKLWELYNIFSKRIVTNLDFAEMVRLVKVFSDANNAQIKNFTFETGPDGPLYSEIASNGAYVLRPKDGNFKILAKQIKDVFKNNSLSSESPLTTPPSTTPAEPLKIVILNGTPIAGLAQQTQAQLEKLNYQIIRIGNAPTQDYFKTIIYKVSDKSINIKELGNNLSADISTLPNDLKYLITPNVDLLIILGNKE